MQKSNNSADALRKFFSAFGAGDTKAVLDAFHPECTITAVRKSPRKTDDLYGTYTGKEGAQDFLQNVGRLFDTKAFAVDHIVGQGDVAFASGSFLHLVKTTGKPFSSDWALMAVVKQGKILEYRFYEDSASFAAASR